MERVADPIEIVIEPMPEDSDLAYRYNRLDECLAAFHTYWLFWPHSLGRNSKKPNRTAYAIAFVPEQTTKLAEVLFGYMQDLGEPVRVLAKNRCEYVLNHKSLEAVEKVLVDLAPRRVTKREMTP